MSAEAPEVVLSAGGGSVAEKPAAGGGAEGAPVEKKLTPKELRMLERAKAASEKAAADAAKTASSGAYGELPLIQSREISGRVWSR
jgi:hypothetical protein